MADYLALRGVREAPTVVAVMVPKATSTAVEVVREAIELFAATHEPSGTFAPGAVWDMRGLEGWTERSEYRGDDEFMEFFRAWSAPYDEWTLQLEEVQDAGAGRVVVVALQRGRPRGADAWVELRFGALYTVADGLVTRVEIFSRPGDAFAAAGLAGGP